MIEFNWPWLFLLLPLPLLVYLLAPPVSRSNESALEVPFLDDFEQLASAANRRLTGNRWPQLLAFASWCLLVTAIAQPYRLGDAIEQTISGRDLMLAVDLSGSMEMEDFMLDRRMVNRLVASKLVAGQFIEKREGDRIGLILFGEKAYLQAPLTFDRRTVNSLLQESAIGLAGDSTAIGDAIGLAVKRLAVQPENQKVLILMTDGANTAGEVQPLKAAELAAQYGLKIYTIGIGADSLVVRQFFGSRKINPSVDLDEDTLGKIAEITGGQYFRARDTQEFMKIYSLLDELEPLERDQQYYRPQYPLYPWPLGLALLLAAGLTVFRARQN